MTTTGERTVLHSVGQRWPTALALVAGATMVIGSTAAEATPGLTEVLFQLPVIYIAIAAVGRPRWSWAVFGFAFVLYGALQQVQLVQPTIVFLAIALAATIWGAGHGADHLWLQVAGMVLFGGIALAAFAVHPDVARYLVAAGWLAHAPWDLYHLVKKRVVHPTYAEACGVLDIVIGTSLLFM